MSDQKRRDSERLIDRTIGISTSGKPNVTETWQKILQESNHEFTELNELLKDPEIFPNQDSTTKFHPHEHEDYSEIFDFTPGLQFPTAGHVSSESIVPLPITLNSDLRHSTESHARGRTPKCALPKCLPISACCMPPEGKSAHYNVRAQKKLRKCDTKLSNFCHELKLKFEAMNTLLRFHSPEDLNSRMPTVVNVASAQIWFVTFALAREFYQAAEMDRRDLIFFRKKYQTVLAYARRLSSDFTSIDASLATIEAKVRKQINAMKETLTGSSQTDLATVAISPNDDFFVKGSSWTELVQNFPQHYNQYDHRPTLEPDAVPSLSYLLLTLDRPDTLRERKELDIYVKNITKAGWSSYRASFDSEKRMKVLRLLMSEAMGFMAQVIGICSSVKRKLLAATRSKPCALLTCRDTLLPWLQETKECVTHGVKISGRAEFEFMRYYIFSAEMRLRKVFTRGRIMGQHLEDICEVATISADLMEKKCGLLLPNYEEIRPYIKVGTKGKVTEDTAVSAFYLHGYGNVLKQCPIHFRISRFILSRKIQLEEFHSGVDFGTRFFSKAESPFLRDDD